MESALVCIALAGSTMTCYEPAQEPLLPDEPEGTVCESGEDWSDENMAAVFADERFSTYSLTLPDEDWQQLRETALDELYTTASLAVDGCAVGSVGLRFKGGYGTLANCFDEQGQQTCDKLSMKLKFDYSVDDKRFHGLKRLNFHSATSDHSLMHDRLAYGMFREMGVVAPRANHAQLEVNGEPLGVFVLVEQIDGRFTDDRFEDGDGNLYKEVWPMDSDPSYYARGLKTNEESAVHTGMIQFADALSTAGDAELPGVLAQHGDPEHFMRLLAVDRAISNWDGIMAWYCNSEWNNCSNHNYYWYEAETGGSFTLIPWDTDNTFALSTPFDQIPAWNDDSAGCDWIPHTFGSGFVRAPGCDPLIRGLALSDQALYLDAVAELLDGPFQLDALNAKLDAWEAQIAAAVALDPSVAASFPDAIAALRADLSLLRLRLENTLAGVPSEPFTLVSDALNDFEATNELSWALGASPWASNGSTVSSSLSTADPIAGAISARMDFEFRDNADPWSQVALMRLSLEGSDPHDLAGANISAIRVRVRSDQARSFRFDLESPQHSNADAGHRFGWDLELTSEVQTFDLLLADAQVPDWAGPSSDDLDAVLGEVLGVTLIPLAVGRNGDGFLGEGISDVGFVEFDDLEFVL